MLPFRNHARLLPALILTLGFAAPATAEDALDECWARSDNRIELSQCLQDLKAETDAALVASYDAALVAQAALDEVVGLRRATRTLERTQMAFELYRNLDCHLQELQAGAGTGSGNFFDGCWIDRTRAHIASLDALAPESPSAGLAGSAWLVEDIEGRGVIDMLQSTLSFESEAQVTGNAGCNRYTGSVAIDGQSISFGPLATTRMACPEAVDVQERRVLDALARTSRYAFESGDLILLLSDREGTTLLRLSRMD
jgi:heat shock protein HslJ